MPLLFILVALFFKGLRVNKTLSEASPLVSLTQGDNSFFNGKLRIPLTRHPLPLTYNPLTFHPLTLHPLQNGNFSLRLRVTNLAFLYSKIRLWDICGL